MSKRRHVGPVVFTEEEWRLHQEMDELLRKQNRIQRQLIARLEEKIRILEGRLPADLVTRIAQGRVSENAAHGSR